MLRKNRPERKEQRRLEAIARAKLYAYELSKAKREGTATEAEWNEKNEAIYS